MKYIEKAIKDLNENQDIKKEFEIRFCLNLTNDYNSKLEPNEKGLNVNLIEQELNNASMEQILLVETNLKKLREQQEFLLGIKEILQSKLKRAWDRTHYK